MNTVMDAMDTADTDMAGTDTADTDTAGMRKKMIDLHIHIVPGIDDGAENLEDALGNGRAQLLTRCQGGCRFFACQSAGQGSAGLETKIPGPAGAFAGRLKKRGDPP